MCRMLGIYGKTDNWKQIAMAFSQQAEKGGVQPEKGVLPGHKDGWGMAASNPKNDTMALINRQSGSASDTPLFKQTLDNINRQPSIFVCHLRKASPAIPITIENVHPFQAGNWVFIHNGSVYRFKSLPRDPSLVLTSQGSDSEYFFHYLISKLGKNHTNGKIRDTLAAAIANMTVDYTSLNSILCNGKKMFVIRKIKKHPDYYTLYTYRLSQAILIAAEPIEADGLLEPHRWNSVPNESILTIGGDPPCIETHRI